MSTNDSDDKKVADGDKANDPSADNGNNDSQDSQDQNQDKGNTKTDEERLAEFEGNAKRLRKKLGLEDEPKKTSKSKSDEFDEGQLAFLATKGIESDEDLDWTRVELKKHGGNLRELLSNGYFQAQLKERRDAKAVLDATPRGERRGSTPATDTLEYHLGNYIRTGKLPADRDMARKVVNAKLHKDTSGSKFTSTPVVGG